MVQNRRIPLILIGLYIMTAIFSMSWLWQFSYQSLISSNQQELERFSRRLETQLQHFAYIPQLLSRQSIIFDALKLTADSAQRDIVNSHLASINQVIDASDIYLLDTKGNTIAASNWQSRDSFVGNNFAFRPYFIQAMVGKQADYFALGSSSGKRGYYFAYPVHHSGEVLGVVVLKMDLSAVEKDWSGKQQHFLVTDTNNIVFISSETSWLFRSLTPLSAQIKEQIRSSRRYADKEISDLSFSGSLNKSPAIIRLNTTQGIGGSYLSLTRNLPNIALQVRVLAPITPIVIDIAMLIAALSLVFILVYLVLILAGQRQSRIREKEQLQVKAKQELEFKVMRRTSALQVEVEERKKAEKALKDTRNESIQAAKLAVLGQLSTSLSHELNNPLAAIRSCADNAGVFIERNKIEQASGNLKQITALTERMAKISSQLKLFARKSDVELSVITLQPVILAAFELVKPQLKASRVKLSLNLPEHLIHVKAEPVQLEQIVVNLLSNAIQAMEESEQKEIEIKLWINQHKAQVEVLDSGPGIINADLNRLFEPFFTTKETGLGLGLSISQQIIQNMRGDIWAENSVELGARFCINLPLEKYIYPNQLNIQESAS
ncbi:sensor histidine kinase [Psychromonas aquimarina]|uniref:sensor histidine kinase n=1 Tax=Psychromonas aquimarina TaxID=444919 RepID=UPI0003F923EC|nr:ATP-binding protein [Psychromonas aquimarina]